MTIYFIQRDSDMAIKIGHAKELEMRIQQHRVDHGAIRVLGLMEGGHEAEKVLHTRFARHCIGGVYSTGKTIGEWFRPALDLVEYITENTKPYRDVKEMQIRFSIPLELYNKLRLFLDDKEGNVHDVARELFMSYVEVIDWQAAIAAAARPSATANGGATSAEEAA